MSSVIFPDSAAEMYTSGSTSLIRNFNKQHVLNLVRLNSGITASEISRITSLQISTVLYTLSALENEGLIVKAGHRASTPRGGKPPMTWKINSGYGHIIGVELLSREIRLVKVDFGANIVNKLHFAYEPQYSSDHYLQRLKSAVKKIGSESGHILGLGIGIPGIVRKYDGIVHQSALFNAPDVPFLHILRESFGFPVYFDNTANTGALSAKWHTPETRNEAQLVYVSVNQNFRGMGVGFIINHHLYRGDHEAAGELREFLSSERLEQIIRQSAQPTSKATFRLENILSKKEVSIKDITEYAFRQHPQAMLILKEIAREISHQLYRIAELFDPSFIIIGGDICEAQDFIKPVVSETLNELLTNRRQAEIKMLYSPFGTFAVAMGSTALVFEHYFNSAQK